MTSAVHVIVLVQSSLRVEYCFMSGDVVGVVIAVVVGVSFNPSAFPLILMTFWLLFDFH
jgi:hypothetical protein